MHLCTSNYFFYFLGVFLAFELCRFCMIIRFFHPSHNSQWTSDFKGFQYQILSITLFSYLNSWERVGGILSFWENLVTWLLRHQMKNKWGLLTYSKTFLSFSFMKGRSFFDVVGNFGLKKWLQTAMHWQNRLFLTFESLTLYLFFLDSVKQCYL